MIFIANKADFSAKNIGKVNYTYDSSEGDEGATTLITQIQIKEIEGVPKIGQRIVLKTIVFPLNAYMRKDLDWESSNPDVAYVSGNSDGTCTMTVLSTGTFTIKAVAKDGSEVEASKTFTSTERTISDLTDETKAILKYYTDLETRTYTDAEKIALDTLVTSLGAQYSNSIWNKIKILVLPCLGSSMTNAAVNVVNGNDLTAVRTSARTNLGFGEGHIYYKGSADSIMFRANISQSNTLKATNGYSFMYGGKNGMQAGGNTSFNRWYLTMMNTKRIVLYYNTSTKAAIETYLTDSSLRGSTTDLTEEGTSFSPQALTIEPNYSGLSDLQSYVSSATYYLDSFYAHFSANGHGAYCMMLGLPMKPSELELLYSSLIRFFNSMGVNMQKYV